MNLRQITYQLALLQGLIISLGSCTKVIELPLSNDTGKLVIEAILTDQSGGQVIKLSQNVPFYTSNVYPPVTGATVAISDQVGTSYPFVETTPGTYTNNALVGTGPQSYTLQVTSAGKTYAASSTMPTLVVLDQITSKQSVFDNDQRTITVHYQDPPGVANWYRFAMFVNGRQVDNYFAASDKFTDGKSVINDLSQNDIDIKPGDFVAVEMYCIDKSMYTYWDALAGQSSNGPNGSVAPANPTNSISPAALGYFSAHTVQRKTMVVPQ